VNPLVLLGLAHAPLAEGPTVGTGEQAMVVVVRGAIAGKQVEAERVGVGKALLVDPGVGYLTATFRGEAARFAQLRLVLVGGVRQDVFDALVPLSDVDGDVFTFEVLPGPIPRAVRSAVAPSAASELAVDPGAAWNVRFGWGALALGYATALALGALRR
jgi:hypothetical protein